MTDCAFIPARIKWPYKKWRDRKEVVSLAAVFSLVTQRSSPQTLKIARILDFCCKSSGLADFKNTVDRGSAVIFDADSGLCPSYVWILGPKRNLDHRSFISLDRSPFLRKINSGITCTSLLLNLYTSVHRCGCGFGFEQKILADRRISRKKGTDRRIYIPLFTPLRKAGLHCLRSSVPLVSVNAV